MQETVDSTSRFSAEQQAVVDRAITAHQHRPGALLPLLHTIQDGLGFVPPPSVPSIARALNLSRAEIQGVISFYHDFRSHPVGKHLLRVCRAEACQSMGADQLAEAVQRELGIRFGDTSADGEVTLEPVYCLGNCACAPAVMLDGQVHGRVSASRVKALLTEPEPVK